MRIYLFVNRFMDEVQKGIGGFKACLGVDVLSQCHRICVTPKHPETTNKHKQNTRKQATTPTKQTNTHTRTHAHTHTHTHIPGQYLSIYLYNPRLSGPSETKLVATISLRNSSINI